MARTHKQKRTWESHFWHFDRYALHSVKPVVEDCHSGKLLNSMVTDNAMNESDGGSRQMLAIVLRLASQRHASYWELQHKGCTFSETS